MPSGERQGLLHHLPRRREIAPPLVVDLGDLLPRPGVELAGRAGRRLPERARLVPAGQALLAMGET